jgi:hypothetical protein
MEKKFIDGLFVNDKKNAPDWVNAKLVVTPKFIEFYNNNCDAKGNLRFDIKTAKDTGKQYAELDTWQPTGDQEKFVKDGITLKVEPRDDGINIENIPF